jgi:predicted RNase H-like nuclease (RuvC/YqgF family)
MEIHKIKKEINQLQTRLYSLEKRLEEIQRNCNHQFKGDLQYETCIKCNKVNVFYY